MSRTGRDGRRWWIAAAAVSLVLAAGVSFYASSQPDGLERVAGDEGFLGAADDHDLADGPLADYGVDGDDGRVSVGLAGAAGVGITLACGAALFRLVRRPAEPGAEPGGSQVGGRADRSGESGNQLAEPGGSQVGGGETGDVPGRHDGPAGEPAGNVAAGHRPAAGGRD